MGPDHNSIANRDYILILDFSGSMGIDDVKVGGKSCRRIEKAQHMAGIIAKSAIKYDPDGITVYTFHNQFKRYDHIKDARMVDRIFKENKPGGQTAVAEVLYDALKGSYELAQQKGATVNGATILVITDGAPYTSDDGLEGAKKKVIAELVKASKTFKHGEAIAVSFVQIGKDARAQKFLKELDDGLDDHGAAYDIVDTKTCREIKELGIDALFQHAILD